METLSWNSKNFTVLHLNCINNALEPCKGSKVKEDLVYFEFARSASAKSKKATGSEALSNKIIFWLTTHSSYRQNNNHKNAQAWVSMVFDRLAESSILLLEELLHNEAGKFVDSILN